MSLFLLGTRAPRECAALTFVEQKGGRRCGPLVRMRDAEIKRMLKASRMPLSGPPPGGRRAGVDKKGSRAARLGEAKPSERHRETGALPSEGIRAAESAEEAAKRRIPEAEVKRLLKAIRTSFCNSPHKKWYWTALVDMYAEGSIGPD
jgi:hypothetical protein